MKSLSEQSDERLCALAAEGDSEAEECLAVRYSRLVRIFARPYFLAGGDSEDLIQEGMIGLLAAIRGYSPEREAVFRTYAEVCVRNRLRSAVRIAARDKHMPLNQSVPLTVFGLDGEDKSYFPNGFPERFEDPEDTLIGREDWENRTKALRSLLSGFEKTVLDFYLRGFSYGEIAHQVSRPVKSVDNAVQRIRRKVAPLLTSGDFSKS